MPQAALIELLGRVGASQGGAVLVNGEELSQWPSEAVKAMKSQRLIAKARPAASVICPGCERDCVMPVHTLPATAGAPASFIVCDKRCDINRVQVPIERLNQWQCSPDSVCGFVSASLGLRRSDKQGDSAGLWEIGIAFGNKRSQMLCLQGNGVLVLVAGSNMVPLAELIKYHDGAYSLDGAMIRRLVDAATTADNRYTPSNAKREVRKLDTQAMYESWKKAYRNLRKKRRDMSDVWYSQQIARTDVAHGRDAETIRKHMKK
ncbi:MAG: hypothetical protein PHY78_12210 [Desulfobacterales bacterium]|nr:hypothetical protein [Desulfobacterales bacterium]MDD4392267.1 hypothetical protein [Desulfobacterales bacterium]